MNIVILAAGQGRRMRSTLPKVLHPVAGRPMLAHVIASARECAALAGGGANIVVVVGHGGDAVRAAFAGDPGLRFVVQNPQRGTGHAVQQAVPLLDPERATLVLYGDVPLVRPATLARLAMGESSAESGPSGAARARGPSSLSILTVALADPSGYGRIVRNALGHVQAIVEHRDASEHQHAIREVNTGILFAGTPGLVRWLAGLRDDNAQREFYLTDVVALARAEGVPVRACVAADESEILGVNSKEQLARVERIAQARSAALLLEMGATLADPARIDVRGIVRIEADVQIDVGCIFEGEVALGAGARIGPYCVLKDTTVEAGAVLQAFTHCDGAHIGAGALVGPYSRLRPGADLGEQVHVGNFVEVKASRLEAGAKANHLSYIGDARVGARSNIGAGTIFANYDGASKHHTEVGADVHVGSNSVLVAPARVGDGATIGAGSTVQREVPAGKLTVARARQVTIENWQRPRKKK
jgi:bifunctional UDP-N-acetylglucosamine pyrophosphorylase/glucosamine-1-phosphate N-acetyltransferase